MKMHLARIAAFAVVLVLARADLALAEALPLPGVEIAIKGDPPGRRNPHKMGGDQWGTCFNCHPFGERLPPNRNKKRSELFTLPTTDM
jgi:hypothetical protein